MKRLLLGISLVLCLFWGPWGFFYLTTERVAVKDAERTQAALIFGALVRDGAISPLHKERLDAAKALLDASKVDVLVVSNSERAAGFMHVYLLEAGVALDQIEIDGDAVQTSDTCLSESGRRFERSVTFISQSFHLPRIALHCRLVGLDGQFVAAETVRGTRSEASVWTKLRVRSRRYVREAALVWSVLLGVYEQD